MPHIDIKMYKGRSEEDKKELANKLVDFLVKEMNRDRSHFSVTIEDYDPEVWREEVLDKIKDEDFYVKPGY